jgi:hypothetical protein
MNPKPAYSHWTGNFAADSMLNFSKSLTNTATFKVCLKFSTFLTIHVVCELWQISLELSSGRVVSLCQDCSPDIRQLVTEIVALFRK